jgi:hypothetical protein
MRRRGPVIGAAAVSLIAIGACAARRGAPIGVSTGGGGPASAGSVESGADAAPPPGNPLPGWRASLSKVNGARFVSKGHAAGRWESDVLADEAGLAALKGAGEVPVGARFVEEHFEHDESGPVMMMEKRPPGFDPERGDWRYVVVGAGGEVVKDGVVESCAGCHGDAPRDHLFSIER